MSASFCTAASARDFLAPSLRSNMAAQSQAEIDAFVAWFQAQGATVDTTAMGLADIPGYGRGVVALRDLPVGAPVPLPLCMAG